MNVDQEHINYEFAVLTNALYEITNIRDSYQYAKTQIAGFVAAYNLFNYAETNRLWSEHFEPEDKHREIVRLIEEQILSLTSARTTTMEEKLSPQDMLDMFKLILDSSKKLGLQVSDNTNGMYWADRYLVFGGRIRKSKV